MTFASRVYLVTSSADHDEISALVQFRNTPKAFANVSPGLERSDNPGNESITNVLTLKGFAARRTLSGFNKFFDRKPRVVAALQPWE